MIRLVVGTIHAFDVKKFVNNGGSFRELSTDTRCGSLPNFEIGFVLAQKLVISNPRRSWVSNFSGELRRKTIMMVS